MAYTQKYSPRPHFQLYVRQCTCAQQELCASHMLKCEICEDEGVDFERDFTPQMSSALTPSCDTDSLHLRDEASASYQEGFFLLLLTHPCSCKTYGPGWNDASEIEMYMWQYVFWLHYNWLKKANGCCFLTAYCLIHKTSHY